MSDAEGGPAPGDLSFWTESDRDEHEVAKHRIVRALTEEAVGKDNRISSADLAERTPVKPTTVRDLIPKVRREYELPIASANGYYLAETADEATEFIERQKAQAEQSLRTAREFATMWNRQNHEQFDSQRIPETTTADDE